MKIVITSTAILCLLIVGRCYGQSHNIFWGTPAWNDTRILYQHVNVSSSFLQVTSQDVAFPSAVSIIKANPNFRRKKFSHRYVCL